MIRINNIKLMPDYKEKDLRAAISKALKGNEITEYRIAKRSLDSRDKDNIKYIISVDVQLKKAFDEEKIVKRVANKNIMLTKTKNYVFPYKIDEKTDFRPVIVGAGPAGYFAALMLARGGFAPILIERGKDVSERTKDVDLFWNGGALNLESNVSFGEGGAGTFSDGKLNTGIKDKEGRIDEVLRVMVGAGAREEITYDAKPHVGTDVLKTVMKNIREEIQELGGEIHFNTRLDDISIVEKGIYKLNLTGEKLNCLTTNVVILAIGHSARDTFKMLYETGFNMEQKPFAIGLRIEHTRHDINVAQYGEKAVNTYDLPASSYKLTYRASNGHSVFSFCMCPGGYVVNASTEEGRMVVNGMSYSGRDADNSNSAIVCSITPDDIPGDMPLDAVAFQRKLEESFFKAGDGMVPVQRYEDFRKHVTTESLGAVKPCIKGKYTLSELSQCLPEYVSDAIIEGIEDFSHKIQGFNVDDAILSGIESRTSSPVRIVRDNDTLMSNFVGIIPCGEGAGYAGGITSAAVDGIKVAEKAAEYILKCCIDE